MNESINFSIKNTAANNSMGESFTELENDRFTMMFYFL